MSTTDQSHSGTKTLLLFVFAGLGLGIVSLALLVLLGAGQIGNFPIFNSHNFSRDFACEGDTETAAFSGNERRWDWSGGDSVDIELPVTVHYGGSNSKQIVATGSHEALAHIQVRDGKIGSGCNNFHWGDVDITLPATRFKHIGIFGPGRVEMTAVDQPELDISIVGPGTVEGRGKIANVGINIVGPGTLKLADLAMDSIDVHIVGPGHLEAGPKNKAYISIIGPGTLKLLSRPPELSTNIIGPANISFAKGS